MRSNFDVPYPELPPNSDSPDCEPKPLCLRGILGKSGLPKKGRKAPATTPKVLPARFGFVAGTSARRKTVLSGLGRCYTDVIDVTSVTLEITVSLSTAWANQRMGVTDGARRLDKPPAAATE